MRQQQQKNRMRGRGRKAPNPLSRNFESNGPDVKIRGNAAHIAEKYSTLARDALSAGDTVMAENYLQHAEHYNRIILASQPQRNPDDQPVQGRGFQQGYDGDDEDGDGMGGGQGQGDQPAMESQRDESRDRDRRRDQDDNRSGNRNGRVSSDDDDDDSSDEVSMDGDNGEEMPSRSRPPQNRNRRRPRSEGPRENGGSTRGEPAREQREGVSADASALPESILGAVATRPSAPAQETTVED
ncbi:MAG: DUF4167 domain-containing protein [Rhizobiaceae bacterium]